MTKNKTVGHIQYSLGKRSANPSEKDSDMKIYPTPQQLETIDLELLAEHIREHGSPFSQGTVVGILTDAVQCLVEMLRAGYGVLLDGLGKFGISLSSEGVEDAETFNAKTHITRVNLTFMPANEVKEALNTKMEFEYVATRKAQAEAKKQEKQALNEGTGDNQGGSGDNQGGSGEGDPGDVTP